VAQDVIFEGLDAPLRLEEAAPVLELLPGIAVGWAWQVAPADPGRQPFFTIRATPDPSRFLCETHVEPAPPRLWDAVNAACDAVAAIALALSAQNRRLICLHAAGVAMAGRLVVFPNVRRAGKSTLSAALARAGHRVFSDDVVPLCFPGGAPARGLAMGIAPRLRLPLPDGVDEGFRRWVAAQPGPGNRQYRYLALPDQPAHGESLAVGALVFLDRQEAPVPARLERLAPDAAMDALLHQNFTRDRHSGGVLEVTADLLARVAVHRLTYADPAGAVDCLEATFAGPAAEPFPVPGPCREFAPAEVGFDTLPPRMEGLLAQRPACVARQIGETLYLADPEGRAIHRMDPLAAAIWDMLESPVTLAEIEALLVAAFPEADRARIAGDLRELMQALAGWGLIEGRVGRG
jgi:hypothetical protein